MKMKQLNITYRHEKQWFIIGEKYTEQIHFRCSENYKEVVEDICKTKNISKSELFRRMLIEYCSRNKIETLIETVRECEARKHAKDKRDAKDIS